MNILFVHSTCFNPYKGGVERVTDVLTKAFLNKGHNVFYLNLYKQKEPQNYKFPVLIYFFPEEKIDSAINRKFYHEFLLEHHVDFVINQSGNFEDSKLFLDVPNKWIKTISVLHSDPLLNYRYLSKEVLCLRNNKKIEYLKLLLRFILFPKIKRDYIRRRKVHFDYLFCHTDSVCILSRTHINSINKVYNGNEKEKICLIANPCAFLPDCGTSKKRQLLYVGRITKGEKRPDRLLKIWSFLYKKYPKWNLTIVGDGEQRPILEQKAKNRERVNFVGFSDPVPYYKESAIFCMTSNFEGFPMVLPEAMSFGVVPLAFDSFPAVSDIIIDNKNGFLIPPFSIKQYVKKIEILINNDSIRQEMAQEGVKMVQNYSVENIVRQWEILFYRLKK